MTGSYLNVTPQNCSPAPSPLRSASENHVTPPALPALALVTLWHCLLRLPVRCCLVCPPTRRPAPADGDLARPVTQHLEHTWHRALGTYMLNRRMSKFFILQMRKPGSSKGTMWVFLLNCTAQIQNVDSPLNKRPANFFCDGTENKHVGLCRPHSLL